MKPILKTFTIVAAASLATLTAQAKGTWTLQGVTYETDTVSHYQVGPGTTMTVIDLKGSVKLRAFYTVTDLDDPNVEVRTLCGKNNKFSAQTIPDMVANSNDNEYIYFAGVNSDLFNYSTSAPIGTTIVNGEIWKIAKDADNTWYSVGFDSDDNTLHFGQPSVIFQGRTDNGIMAAPKYVNAARGTNECVLYSSHFGSKTGTDAGGLEVAFERVNTGLMASGTTQLRVTGTSSTEGNMSIPSMGYVISSTNTTYNKYLATLKSGDIVYYTPTFYSNPGGMTNYTFTMLGQMSGGNPIILLDGEITNTDSALDHLKTRRPRTSLGVDATGKKMVLMVVEGDAINSSVSAGVVSKDLAAMMKAVGCSTAINFDGGGSSIMYTSPLGVLNNPSDGSYRKVSNGWFVATRDKGDTTVASIKFLDTRLNIDKNTQYTPVIYGYNAAGLLVDTKVTDYTLSCPAELGTVSTDGKTLVASGTGLHALTAKVGTMTATVPVYINGTNSVDAIGADTNTFALRANIICRGTDVSATVAAGGRVDIFNMSGAIVASTTATGAGDITLPTASLATGHYIVRSGSAALRLVVK